MRYLILAPDYTGSCIREEYGDCVTLDELSLAKDFIEEIENWHELYRGIIPLDQDDRWQRKKEIESLDQSGINLAQRLALAIPGGAKVKYFSEGLLRFLPVL